MAASPAGRTSSRGRPAPRLRVRVRRPRRAWVRKAFMALGALSLVGLVVAGYFWVSYARLIDARLGGEVRPVPRIFGRPFEMQVGAPLSPAELVQRLNDVGYAQRPQAAEPGEFSVAPNSVLLVTRPAGEQPARTVRVDFTTGRSPIVRRLVDGANKAVGPVTLEAPLLAALAPGQKRRRVPLSAIPEQVQHAVLAIEDRRFYEHPGVDPIRAVGALLTNLRGDKPYLVGASTLTQQIVKNTFLTPDKTLRRKLQEQFMALVLDSRLTKDQILELYLNEVVLGQRGPFAIHGVGEASRIFFGKDVSNVSLAEAATLAGVIQSPSALSPFRHADKARDRRNVVLSAMVEAGYITADEAKTASAQPLKISARALENEAPYFVDYVSKLVDETNDGLLDEGAVDIYTTLDLQMQRIAQEAVASGLADIDRQLSKRKQGLAQAALIAVDPRTGDILAMVAGRSYSETQYNRVVTMRRQPGSIFKPFVYLAAFEETANSGLIALTPATVLVDEPTTFKDGDDDYAPANYKDEYGGPMTLHRGLALSRNIISIKVAELTGYDRVAGLWKRIGVGTPALAVPSIALGVFEASPLEMATAYTLFPNGGAIRPLRAVDRIAANGKTTRTKAGSPQPVARPETTYLVTNMLRSVLSEGTGARVRASGFALDAAGKTGTTNDQRDAWFVGFTPELLTVVWVGFDDNQPIGLTGSQAALPIWLSFMQRATAGRPDVRFAEPEGLSYAVIDPDTGELATAGCPRTIVETFLPGTEPQVACELHGGTVISTAWNRLRSFLRRIIR